MDVHWKAITGALLVSNRPAEEHVGMSIRRFLVSDLTGDRIQVTGGEAAHALKVLRLSKGDPVILFDGRGAEAEGTIGAVDREAFEVEVSMRRAKSPRMTRELTIAAAIPKGERADWMIEKCAELGVARLVPLVCERSQVKPGEAKLERWRRKAAEAAKQSRQASMMDIKALQPLGEYIASVAADSGLLFGDGNASQSMQEAIADRSAGTNWVICIGPEGGFTEEERKTLCARGAQPVSLGPTILRVETAVVAAAAVWACSHP